MRERQTSAASLVGSAVSHYTVLSLIGAGGMGEVYRASDTRLGRDVAIKVLPAAFSKDADRLRRFEQEARAAGMLNHPNILIVHALGTHEGAPYIVSELLAGGTLRERLAEGALPPRLGADYALQIARGLAAAHEKGIVHRDLKRRTRLRLSVPYSADAHRHQKRRKKPPASHRRKHVAAYCSVVIQMLPVISPRGKISASGATASSHFKMSAFMSDRRAL